MVLLIASQFTVPRNSTHPRQLALREKIHHALFIVAISQFTRSQLYRWADAGRLVQDPRDPLWPG